jgi:preprotein translocase subunit YajC
MDTRKPLKVRADEVIVGDEIALTGLVGTVTKVTHAGSIAPHVKLAIRTNWGTVDAQVVPAARPVVIAR